MALSALGDGPGQFGGTLGRPPGWQRDGCRAVTVALPGRHPGAPLEAGSRSPPNADSARAVAVRRRPPPPGGPWRLSRGGPDDRRSKDPTAGVRVRDESRSSTMDTTPMVVRSDLGDLRPRCSRTRSGWDASNPAPCGVPDSQTIESVQASAPGFRTDGVVEDDIDNNDDQHVQRGDPHSRKERQADLRLG